MWLPLRTLCRGDAQWPLCALPCEYWKDEVSQLFHHQKLMGNRDVLQRDFIRHCWETYSFGEFGSKAKTLLVSQGRKKRRRKWWDEEMFMKGGLCQQLSPLDWCWALERLTQTEQAAWDCSLLTLTTAGFAFCRLWSVFDQWIETDHSSWEVCNEEVKTSRYKNRICY